MADVTSFEEAMIAVWEAHTRAEFVDRSADAAIDTMTDKPALVHVPVGTGATGREPLRAFYRDVFIPQVPPDLEMEPLTRTISRERIVEEFILRLTHSVRMDWFAPGIEPTGRRLAVPFVGIVAFEGLKIASEHIYWDNATVLKQLGVLGDDLPVLGIEQADRLLDPAAPANRLIA